MIKLFSLKQEKEASASAGDGSGTKKVAPGLIRMQKGVTPPYFAGPRALVARTRLPPNPGRAAHSEPGPRTDMSELKLEAGLELEFPGGKEDLLNFKVHISPDEGIYRNGRFTFDFKVPKSYPHDPPKVLCETTVFHPNIDMEGHVCLNILREDWKPVLTIQSVLMGLQFLMLEPNADDPLNKEASTAHSTPLSLGLAA